MVGGDGRIIDPSLAPPFGPLDVSLEEIRE